MKPGDLVILKEKEDMPSVAGALTALKFYQRMIKQYEGKIMLVIEMINDDNAALILVDGYLHSLGKIYLRVVSETR